MATPISTLAANVQSRFRLKAELHLRWQLVDRCLSLKGVSLLSRLLCSWERRKTPSFVKEMRCFVTVWADQFQIIWRRVSRIMVFMVNLKNAGYGIISAASACIMKRFSRISSLPIRGTRWARRGLISSAIKVAAGSIAKLRSAAWFLINYLAALETLENARLFFTAPTLPGGVVFFQLPNSILSHGRKGMFHKTRFTAKLCDALASSIRALKKLAASAANHGFWTIERSFCHVDIILQRRNGLAERI
jgi:hypothetical protein